MCLSMEGTLGTYVQSCESSAMAGHVTVLQWPALKYCSPELPDIKKRAVFTSIARCFEAQHTTVPAFDIYARLHQQ